MRRLALVLLAACSVPDKHPSTTDGGMDAPLPVDDDAIPDTTITEAPAAFANSGSSTFKFTASYANATFECAIDGDSPVPCSSPYTRALSDGSHNFSVRAINKKGMGDMSPAEHLWMIDTVAPNTMMLEAPPAADNSVMVRFSFMSNEDNVTFDCSLDGAAYVACESGSDFGPVSDGSHSFAVRARDRAGNVDTSPSIHAWSVDTSTPDTQLLSGPDGAVASSDATFTFVSPDAGSGATFECSLDGGAMVACASPYTINNLVMGDHTFQVRVRDSVGNYDPTPATRAWSVDLTPPETTIDTGPIGYVRLASAQFTFTANETPVTFTCSLDGAAFVSCTSPQDFSMLGQGAHTFAVRATDAANHTDASPATRAWTVDTVAPDVQITTPTETSTTGPRVIFNFTASEGAVACSVDGALFVTCASPFGVNFPAGGHSLQVRATDDAGNVTTTPRVWTVACSPAATTGAVGVLYLDDAGQTLANATGGAAAFLGTNDTVEAVDPALAAGRFVGSAVFAAAEADLVMWPAALGAMSNATIELWTRPEATGGTRDLFVSGDGNIAIRVTAVSPTTVRISTTVDDGPLRTVQSAALPAGAWHHVLVSLGGGLLRQWTDGARVEMASGGSPALDTVTLGGNYTGAIDEVWVSPTPIVDDETALARWCPL